MQENEIKPMALLEEFEIAMKMYAFEIPVCLFCTSFEPFPEKSQKGSKVPAQSLERHQNGFQGCPNRAEGSKD